MDTENRLAANKEENIKDVWLKAAIVGGLWAAIEIILGSFMHNLRIPFAGSTLTIIGIALLVSFHRMWPERGLIIRAGIICALMKSVSPSSVILGPMSGIFFEALLLETGLFILGTNYAGYFTGAVLGMLSTLVHKIVSLLILYGLDIVTIYKNIYFFLARQMRIEELDPWLLVWIVLGVYVLFGALAAWLGISVGNRSRFLKADTARVKLDRQHQDFFKTNPNQKFRFSLLLIHAFSLPFGLYLINYSLFLVAFIFYAIYLGFCIVYYGKSLRRLKKPVFWFQLFMISLLASVFWNGFSLKEEVFNLQGLYVGLEMNMRAIFVVISFSSLGVELRNPAIKDLLFRKGFGELYAALGLAFDALPGMIKSMPRPMDFIRNPLMELAKINRQAEYLLRSKEFYSK